MKYLKLSILFILTSCAKLEQELNVTPEEAKEIEKDAVIVVEKVVEKAVQAETGLDIAPFLPNLEAPPCEKQEPPVVEAEKV